MRNDPYPLVPQELKKLNQWVLWQSENRNGKLNKIPKQADGRNAQSNNPKTWNSYQSVCESEIKFTGIGFVFSKSDAYCGIDLDYCINDGQIKNWAKPIIDKLKNISYGEVSPSGNGIKFWTQAVLPANVKHKVYIGGGKADAIEIYDRGRYFTVTGNGKGNIFDGQSVLDWIYSQYFIEITPERTESAKMQNNASASEIISLINNSRQHSKFSALMAGNITGYGSNSEADQALCSLLAFWTQDPIQIDAIFRQSILYREKWDEKHRGDGATYGQMTIEKALSENRQNYTPPKKKKKKSIGFYERRERRRRYDHKR